MCCRLVRFLKKTPCRVLARILWDSIRSRRVYVETSRYPEGGKRTDENATPDLTDTGSKCVETDKKVTEIQRENVIVVRKRGEPDVRGFVQGLTWLQPSLALSESSVQSSSKSRDVSMPWLLKCLEDRNLSDRLSWLLSDQTHVSHFYQPTAFLSKANFTEAAILCLMAFEQNLLPLLTIINPKLAVETQKEATQL
ncbi:hypothetical protein M8J75_009290 [Diaphorina citri]|nr:hypothetical protein M8J75_009290 [Diaphorina citri]